jgi:transcriptional regulator with XRE-family HTH domain
MGNAANGRYSREILPSYLVDDLLGFPVEVIDSVQKEVCPESGDINITITNVPGLIAAACVARVLLPQKLSGKEIKSLRKSLEITGKALAEILNVTAETISRWENDKEPIGPNSELLLRAHVAIQLKERTAIPFDLKQIIEMKIESACMPKDKPIIQLILNKNIFDNKNSEGVYLEPEKEQRAA